MARMVSSLGFSRRSRPRISAPIYLLSGTTSNRVRVSTVMGASRGLRCHAGSSSFGSGRGRVVRFAMLDFAAGQGGKNFCHQLARGGGAQFHRDAIAPAIRFADEVDAERMIERRVEGMIVIDIGGVDPHPALGSLGAAQKFGLLNDVRAHDDDLLEASGRARRGRRGKMFVEERKHLVPAVERLLRAIGRARGIEKGMAGAVVAVKLVSLAQLLEHGLGAVHLVTVWILIVIAEQPSRGQRSLAVRSIGATGR